MATIVIDNFLDNHVFQQIKTEMYSDNFPWYYNPTKSRGNGQDDIDHKANQQMFHIIYGMNNMLNEQQSLSMPLIMPILQKLKPLTLLRIKANLQFGTEELYQSPFHLDSHEVPAGVKFYTCVFYLNTNNGLTVFEDTDETVESKANRIVIFDGTRRHAGTTCTDEKTRMVINLNFVPSNETNLEELQNNGLHSQ